MPPKLNFYKVKNVVRAYITTVADRVHYYVRKGEGPVRSKTCKTKTWKDWQDMATPIPRPSNWPEHIIG